MFRTTVWSQLAEAGARNATASQAFVSRYRPPLLAFLGRRGLSPEDSEDVAQEVFVRLFHRDLLNDADRTRGRFRSFLLGVATNVLLEHRRHGRRLKRGGGARRLSLAELELDPVDPKAGAEFDECWIQHLVTRAMKQVQDENPRQHELLTLAADGISPGDMAQRLERTPGQLRTDLHRARKRLAKHIRAEVARYCSSQEEFEAELRAILGDAASE